MRKVLAHLPFVSVASLLLIFGLLGTAQAALKKAPVSLIEGTDIVTGTPVKIEFEKSKSETVVVFLSANCPCSNSHEKILEQLRQEFPQANFVGVHSNADETAEVAKDHFARSHLSFSVVNDPQETLANAFKALKTPHVFVINPQREIVYAGGVTDSHEATRAKKFYLKDALTDLAAGRAPKIAETRTLGCAIKR